MSAPIASIGSVIQALRTALPASPVLLGEVVEIHADDTSTVRLPTQLDQSQLGQGVETGSLIRARGAFVPVGENAFVRDGVIETRAPGGVATNIVIGRVVDPPKPLAFAGPIPDQALTVGAAYSLDLKQFWTGGLPALRYRVASGVLPAGVTLGELTGLLTGPATAALAAGPVVFEATDGLRAVAQSNPVQVSAVAAAQNRVIVWIPATTFASTTDGGVSFTALPLVVAGRPEVPEQTIFKAGNAWLCNTNVIIDDGLAAMYRSTNLVTWTAVSGAPIDTLGGGTYLPIWGAIASNGSRVVAFNSSVEVGVYGAYSDNAGVTWSASASSQTLAIRGTAVVWSAAAGKFFVGAGSVWSSADGNVWTLSSSEAGSWRSAAVGAAAIVFSSTTGKVLRSTNGGTSWTATTLAGVTPGKLAASPAGHFVLLNGNAAPRSSVDDGATWQASAGVNASHRPRNVAWTGQEFLLSCEPVGAGQVVLYASPTGATWTLRNAALGASNGSFHFMWGGV